MYHRILPQDDKRSQVEEPGMTVTPETFRQHINILKHYFNIVKLADWIQLKSEGKELPSKSCAITFDDGWVDNFEFAFPVLNELNVPATIFLVSNMVGKNAVFWPERLTRLINEISSHYPQYWLHRELKWLQKDANNYRFSERLPTREELSALIACVKNYSDQEINDRLTHIETVLQIDTGIPSPSLLNWKQVTEMVSSGLVEIGSHTRHHVRLNEQTPVELIKNEIINSKAEIEKNIDQTVKTFCFPNGDYYSQSLELVRQNYLGAVTTQSGWNTADADLHKLQRIGIHQDITQDKISFLARISGWM
jgi:peptidoglycan/xylan/chitin deacetylase (PgdA/CDA1 family)